MKDKLDFVNSTLEKIKKNDLYRQMQYSKISGPYIVIKGKKLINLCSNDYLGISTNIKPQSQLQSSSRLVSGNDNSYAILEQKLAKHKTQEKSLVFPTGYMANFGAISTIIKKGDMILSDELNHASIIQACKLTSNRIFIYKHNDMEDLSKKIKHKNKRKFIITEGIFSMDGDFANLKSIVNIAEKNNAILILDDAHGDFTVGNDGKGSANHFGVSKKIDLYISSLSKGLGSFGGYIASRENVIDLCINKAKSFIYTSSLPSFLIEDSLKRFNSNREKQRKKLCKNVEFFSTKLNILGFYSSSDTHIIPLIIGKEKTAMEFGRFLFKNGVFAQPIRYPTVPKNKARIRISITARLSKTQMVKSLEVIERAKNKFKI